MTLQTRIQSADEAEIDAVLASIGEGHKTRDASKIGAAYAPGARIFELAPPLVHAGLDVASTQAWLDTWRTPVQVEPQDTQVLIDGDLAVVHGLLKMSGAKIDSDPFEMWFRGTTVLKRIDGAWKIVHDHTSVPFHMDGSFRAATDLQP